MQHLRLLPSSNVEGEDEAGGFTAWHALNATGQQLRQLRHCGQLSKFLTGIHLFPDNRNLPIPAPSVFRPKGLQFEPSTIAVLPGLDRYRCDLRTYGHRRRLLVLASRALSAPAAWRCWPRSVARSHHNRINQRRALGRRERPSRTVIRGA